MKVRQGLYLIFLFYFKRVGFASSSIKPLLRGVHLLTQPFFSLFSTS